MKPRLVIVERGSEDEMLFRYASLHWSIPVSSGYGRRLRFLIEDASNGKLIGIVGLSDPVYGLGVRDRWIGWDNPARAERLQNVMDAFVLGAVPPYNTLLCGKLAAMLVASSEVRDEFSRKYAGVKTRIRQRTMDGQLALVTTVSALGRSSLYNRLQIADRSLYERLGFTQGWGEFHFANGTFEQLRAFAQQNCVPSYRKVEWGTGFRNRREIVKKGLPALGISSRLICHGVEREVFGVPMATNTQEFLRGVGGHWHSEYFAFHTMAYQS